MHDVERLRELLLELELARVQEANMRAESEALLAALRALAGPIESPVPFTSMLEAVRDVIPWHHAFILASEPGEPLRTLVSTSAVFEGAIWSTDALFRRVLQGEIVAVFNVALVPEWMQQPEQVRSAATSALHVPLVLGTSSAILVCTHGGRGQFGRKHVQFAKRLAPVASQALVTLQLRQTARERDRFFHVSRELLCVLDQEGRFLHLNPSWSNTLGWSFNDVYARQFAELVAAEDRDNAQVALSELREGKPTTGFDARIACADGSHRWVSWTFTGFAQEGSYYGAGHDITARVRLEEQLRQSQKMEAIGRLAGGIAHDMNNLLGAINTLGSLIEMQMEPGSSMAQDVAEILAACRRGKDLTTNLLGFARKGMYVRKGLMLNTVVQDVVGLLARTVPKNIHIETELAPDLKWTEGDPAQLSHAVMNVCLNAVDAMRAGGTLQLITDNVMVAHSGSIPVDVPEVTAMVRLRISDTGVGMSEDVASRAFEPFFTTKPKGEGTGLGLSMVYGTVKNHGGSVTIDSVVGKGTTVSIKLPVAAATQPRSSTKPTSQKASQAAAPRVLLIDDEPLLRGAVCRLLTRSGYEVLQAENGKEGLAVFDQHQGKIQLVLLDQVMPVMDGEQTFRALRERNPRLKVIILSGYTREGKPESLLAQGALAFIQKPFEAPALLEAIRKAIHDHR